MKIHILVSASALFALSSSFSSFAPPPGTTGLTIVCPPTAKITCGTSTDPEDTGTPTVSSDCPGRITVTYVDDILPGSDCAAERFDSIIQRTWTATDLCGNSASCTQLIDVIRQQWSLDIKPTSCPNPINVNGSPNATVTIAILGTATQDVTLIDPDSVQIWREHCTAGPVSPESSSLQDVAAPVVVDAFCACGTAGPDGITDLRLGFNRGDLVQGLGLANEPYRSFVRLVVTGQTIDGCSFLATDCVRVQ